jgi:hypothetical protein
MAVRTSVSMLNSLTLKSLWVKGFSTGFLSGVGSRVWLWLGMLFSRMALVSRVPAGRRVRWRWL